MAERDEIPDVLAVLAGLPAALRTVRTLRRKSLREVARETGLSPSTVMRIENGDDCALSNAVTVLRWIQSDAAVDALLGGTDE